MLTLRAAADANADRALEHSSQYVNDFSAIGGKGDVRAVYFALVAIAYRLEALTATLADLATTTGRK